MKRGIIFWIALLMAVALFSPAAVLGQADKTAKTVNIRITGHMPVGQVCSTACEMFIKEAEKKSNGALKFTYYPAGQLAMDVKAFEMCQRGGIEMAQFFTSRAVGSIPEGDLAYPYFDDPDWCWRMRQHDYHTRYVPTATMWHKASRTAGSYSPSACYALGVNAVVFMQKYAHLPQWLKWFVYAVLSLPLLFIVRTFQGKGKSVWAKALGIWDGFHGVRVTAETFRRKW